jgi:uncharacterized membrane protein
MLAPCSPIAPAAPWHWLRLAWADIRANPAVSLSYGGVMTLLSWLLSAATWYWGNVGLYLGLLSGFVFLGPILAMGLYAASAQRAMGVHPVRIGPTLSLAREALGDALVFALVLLVVFLLWARSAMMITVFFPAGQSDSWDSWLSFLGVGTAVGAIFSAVVFGASAFSLPMMLDRRSDTITAVLSSVNAVLRNKPAMLVWGCIIVAVVVVDVLTLYLAGWVLLPLLGHAAWHGYHIHLDASAWAPRWSAADHASPREQATAK